MHTLYPLEYTEAIQDASAETGIPESLICAVIKTESGFDPQAESHAGAKGLMQMIPDTFSWIQRKTDGVETIGEEGLFQPEINIQYGALVLREMLEMFENVDTALCAYNAGPGTVQEWLENPAYSVDGKTLQNIPYTETEQYVKRVRQNQAIYEKLYAFPLK